jgi:hypothetical protein
MSRDIGEVPHRLGNGLMQRYNLTQIGGRCGD